MNRSEEFRQELNRLELSLSLNWTEYSERLYEIFIISIYLRILPNLDEERFTKINKVLAGNRNHNDNAKITTEYYYQDNIIERGVETIHRIGSVHGAHDNETALTTTDSANFPSNYTLKTLLYSLLM